VNEVALDLPAKQWTRTLFFGASPSTFSAIASLINLIA
jgi:hypothetical protein